MNIGDFVKKLVDMFAPMALDFIQDIADGQVNGADLSEDQLKLCYEAYVLSCTRGNDLVLKTDNDYDNMTLSEVQEFLADTLNEAGIATPDVPF